MNKANLCKVKLCFALRNLFCVKFVIGKNLEVF
jgi:hypothetical protein